MLWLRKYLIRNVYNWKNLWGQNKHNHLSKIVCTILIYVDGKALLALNFSKNVHYSDN